MAAQLFYFSRNSANEAFADALSKQLSASFIAKELSPAAEVGVDLNPDDQIFLDFSAEEINSDFLSNHPSIKQFLAGHDLSNIHGIFAETQLSKIVSILSPMWIGNILVRREEGLQSLVEPYARRIQLSRGQGPCASSLLGPKVEIEKFRLTRTGQKRTALDGLESYLSIREQPPRICSIAVNALDELLMNALFDAPADEKGNQVFATVPRNADFELTHAPVDLEFGCNEGHFGATVIDYHGTLQRQVAFQSILKMFATDFKAEFDPERVGAGLGLALLFRSGGNYTFRILQGRKTEVSVLFRLNVSFASMRKRSQFIATQLL